jgi:hypothetical protein
MGSSGSGGLLLDAFVLEVLPPSIGEKHAFVVSAYDFGFRTSLVLHPRVQIPDGFRHISFGTERIDTDPTAAVLHTHDVVEVTRNGSNVDYRDIHVPLGPKCGGARTRAVLRDVAFAVFTG